MLIENQLLLMDLRDSKKQEKQERKMVQNHVFLHVWYAFHALGHLECFRFGYLLPTYFQVLHIFVLTCCLFFYLTFPTEEPP